MSTSTLTRTTDSAPAEAAGSATRWCPADLAVLALLAWWATWLTWDVGGRQQRIESIGLVLAAVALIAVRPDRVLKWWQLLPPVALVAGSWLVVATAPTGWTGANGAGSYTLAAATFLVLGSWARDHQRRWLVVIVILLAAGMEFEKAFVPWWGGQDPSAQMYGTFYWTNPYAIFMLPGALLGFWGASVGNRLTAILGWIIGPLSIAAVVFSTSRATEIAFGAGWIALAVLLAVGSRWIGLIRLAGVSVLGLATTYFFSGPPIFPTRAGVGASTAARSASFTSNGTQRFEDWRRAFEVFLHWPVTGAGYDSFLNASLHVTTYHDSTLTGLAHNGYMQALSDGGLTLAVPLWIGAAMAAVAAVRTIWRELRRRKPTLASALAVAFLLLLLHSGMDFDWSYPALLSLSAIGAAMFVSVPDDEPRPAPAADVPNDQTVSDHERLRLAALLGVIAFCCLGVIGAWHGGLSLNLPLGISPLRHLLEGLGL